MAGQLAFKIVTPERKVYESDVDSVTLPTTEGEITILPGHLSLVALLKSGELKVKSGNEEITLAVAGGFIKNNNSQLVVLADSAEHAEEIDLAKAEEAYQKAAQAMLEAKDKEDFDFTALAVQLEHELTRVKVATRRKYKNVGGKNLSQPN